jgi:hypothetical protein
MVQEEGIGRVRRLAGSGASLTFTGGFAVLLTLASIATAALADTPILLADARAASPESLATGDQLLLSDQDGPLRFAGHDLRLVGFSGIVGYASDVAYVVVVQGEAMDGRHRAHPGELLLLPPFGAPVGVQRFDAERLARQWSAPARAARPQVFGRLNTIAAGQSRSLFFGRLSRTTFNAAAPGGARRELASRTLLGARVVRDIRFDGRSDAASVELRIVTAFRDALIAGDAEAVAALMDPTPFGGRQLAGGAREARLLSAQGLLASRNWAAALDGAPPTPDGRRWQVGAVRLTLRSLDDFTFIHTVEGGAR